MLSGGRLRVAERGIGAIRFRCRGEIDRGFREGEKVVGVANQQS